MNPKRSSIITDPGCYPDPSTMTRMMNGKKVEPEVLREKATIMACGNMLPSNAIYGFETDDEFQEWCDGLTIADAIRRTYRFIEQAKKYEVDNLANVEAAWKDAVETKSDSLKKMASRLGVEENSRDLFLAAEGLTGHPLAPRVLNSGILYDRRNFGGSWRPVFGYIPVLSWIGFNDRTSSVRMSGVGCLTEHSWYRGRKKLWMLGIPWMEFPDLGQFDFNDIASSAVILPI